MNEFLASYIFTVFMAFIAGFGAGWTLKKIDMTKGKPDSLLSHRRRKFRKKSNRFVDQIDSPPLLELRSQGLDNPAIAKKSGWSSCTVSHKIGRQPNADARKALRKEWLKKQRELKRSQHVSP